MEPQPNPVSDQLDQLLSLAQPRPDLITPGSQAPGVLNMPRPATWAGRVIYQGQKPDPTALLGMMPMGGAPDEESLTAPVATTSMIGGIGASLKNLARSLKGKFNTAIVDAEGNPKLLFHGTPSAYSEFDPSKAKPGLYGKAGGGYWTDDPSVTTGYTQQNVSPVIEKYLTGKDLAPNVRPAFVRMQNPFDVERGYTKEEARKIIAAGATLRPRTGLTGVRGGPEAYDTVNVLEGDLSREAGKTNVIKGERLFQSLKSILGDEDTTKAFQLAGYDGIKYVGGKATPGQLPHQVVIAFSPDQVVSAFDPSLQPQAVTGGTPLKLPPEVTKALTTPGTSSFTVTLPKRIK